MAKVYASLIIKERKLFKDVPEKDKEAVRQELIDRGREDLIIE